MQLAGRAANIYQVSATSLELVEMRVYLICISFFGERQREEQTYYRLSPLTSLFLEGLCQALPMTEPAPQALAPSLTLIRRAGPGEWKVASSALPANHAPPASQAMSSSATLLGDSKMHMEPAPQHETKQSTNLDGSQEPVARLPTSSDHMQAHGSRTRVPSAHFVLRPDIIPKIEDPASYAKRRRGPKSLADPSKQSKRPNLALIDPSTYAKRRRGRPPARVPTDETAAERPPGSNPHFAATGPSSFGGGQMSPQGGGKTQQGELSRSGRKPQTKPRWNADLDLA